MGCARGGVREISQIFGDLNFGIDLPAQEFFDRVISDVRQFSERKSFDDDVCVVGMEVQHTG